MLSLEQNDRLTRVGPGTPCGELMRRYWHPIAAVSQMKDRYTMPVRILAEDLVLYKDRSGTFGLVDSFCPHRRMGMVYGIAEEHGLRCAYHGWLFNETGRVLEMPYEETEDPQTRFKEKVQIRAYPVQEQAGLIFAYLGPAPVPLLPQWDVFAVEDVVRDIGLTVLPSNWLQCQENSLDPVHVEWLHSHWANYIAEMRGEPEKIRRVIKHDRIGFDTYEYGIIKRRVVEGGSEEDSAWADGHPIVFPYYLRQGGSGIDRENWGLTGPAFQIRVPIDDTTTAHWWVMNHPKASEDEEQRPEDIPFFSPPLIQLDEQKNPQWSILDSNSAQDVAAWTTQGAIADRTKENLGRSDKGIIMFRRMLEQNIRVVEDGGDPMNTFRDPAQNVYLPMETERSSAGRGQSQQGGASFANIPFARQGMASKYSPILNARGVEGGVDAAERRRSVGQ